MATRTEFHTELEGVRGYAFLLVFFAHYTYPLMVHHNRWTFPFRVLVDLAWVAVPVFFVLSGFLITGILLRTRERQRFFRVFYARRAIRVFPLYYLIVLSMGLIGISLHNDMEGYWTNLFYVQNLWPAHVNLMRGIWIHGVQVELGHFWSLAIEEQFYLVWPVVIWFCRSRRSLLTVLFGLIAAATLFRCFAAHFGLTPQQAYFLTFTRADAIVLGALMAVWRGERMYERLERIALPTLLGGTGLLLAARVLSGASNPYLGDSATWRVTFLIPVVNLTAMAIVLETMRQGSVLRRLCHWSPACRLGAISYSCYAFHLLLCIYCCSVMMPQLEQHMPRRFAIVTMLSLSFAVTVALGKLSYRWLEQPAMQWKERFKYGAAIERQERQTSRRMPRPVSLWTRLRQNPELGRF